MQYQEKYWRELDQLKIHVIYLELYQERNINIDRNVNMFLAIASSSSIASWAIWSQFSFVWATLIAFSQVISAIKSHLPYSKRLKALHGITNDLEALFLAMESDWFAIAEGQLPDDDTHKLHMNYKEKRRIIINKYLGSDPLPVIDSLLAEANEQAGQYFKNFYG